MGKKSESRRTGTVRVETSNGLAGVFAARDHVPGEHLLSLIGYAPAERSRYTIQVAVDRHLDPTVPASGIAAVPAPWRYLNHGCDPNLEIDLDAQCFSVRRAVAAGEELTFNYLTTEGEMASSFQCMCGAPDCYGMIRGFKHLSPADQAGLLPSAAPHIRSLLGSTRKAKSASSPAIDGDRSTKR